MESTANFGGYTFVNDNPAMFIDPTGLKFRQNQGGPPDQGTGDNPGYLSEWEDIFNVLYYGGSGHGGSWTSSGGTGGGGSYDFYGSDADAFMHGSMDMDQNSSWGNDGFATNFQDAQKSYYKNGGTDDNVGYLAPTVYLKGFSKQAVANLDAQIARNAGMGLGDNKNEESNGWKTVSTVSETFDRGMVASGDVIFTSLAVSSTLTKETFNMISEVPVLKQFGVVTSVVSLYNHGSNFIKDPNWKDGLEFLGNAAILTAKVLFPEATLTINGVEFIYNNVTTVIDLFDSKSD